MKNVLLAFSSRSSYCGDAEDLAVFNTKHLEILYEDDGSSVVHSNDVPMHLHEY